MALWCSRARLSFHFSHIPTSSVRHTSQWSRQSTYQFFFTHTPAPRLSFSKKAFWLVPIGAGLALCLTPTSKSPLAGLIASPTVIPIKSPCTTMIIESPMEPELSIRRRIVALFRDKLWEPIRTAARFIHLFVLFMPVIIGSPMVLVGRSEKRYKGDGWGAIWWYDLLVLQMQAAGPTFIKVRCVVPCRT